MVNNIDAIQSYLIGMSKIHMNYVNLSISKVLENYEQQMKDIVLFDLDENILVENTIDKI